MKRFSSLAKRMIPSMFSLVKTWPGTQAFPIKGFSYEALLHLQSKRNHYGITFRPDAYVNSPPKNVL